MELIEASQVGRFVAALVFVVGLMILLAQVMKRFDGQVARRAGKKRRLQIVEVLPIDARHRAVLLRRDDREHLVLLGANGDRVIETNIESPQDGDHEKKSHS